MTGAYLAFSSAKCVKHDCVCWVMGIVSMHDEADLCRAKAANSWGNKAAIIMGAAVAIVLWPYACMCV